VKTSAKVFRFIRRVAYFLLFWCLLIWAEAGLNILPLRYVAETNTVITYSYQGEAPALNTLTIQHISVTEVIDIILGLFVDVVLAIDLSRIVTRKFEDGR
jgi:hypothetical protein